MRNLFFLSIVVLFINIETLQSQINISTKKNIFSEKVDNYFIKDTSFTIKKNKSPLLAGTLSFIVPGAALGQLYNEQYLNFGIRVGISVLTAIWFFESPPFNIAGDGNSSYQKLGALALYSINWISSVFDAVLSANNYNNGIKKLNKLKK